MKKKRLNLSLEKSIITKFESKLIIGNGLNNSNNTECPTRGPACAEKTYQCETRFPGCPNPQTVEVIIN